MVIPLTSLRYAPHRGPAALVERLSYVTSGHCSLRQSQSRIALKTGLRLTWRVKIE
jgi:hypothetical protein